MRKQLIILVLITISIIGCKKQEDTCLPVTSYFLQGQWSDYCNQCYAFSIRTFEFTFFDNDSFKLYNNYVTDILYPECGSNNDWDIYVKGKWSLDNNFLSLDGFYCDENYEKLVISPCWQVVDTGMFSMEFNNVYYCSDTLVLENTLIGGGWKSLIKLKRE